MEKIDKLRKLFHSKYVTILYLSVILLSFCYIGFLSPIDKVIKLITYVMSSIYIMLYLIDRKFTKYSKLLMLFFIVSLIATIIGSDASIVDFSKLYVKILGLSFFLERSIINNPKDTIKYLYHILWVLIFINFMTIIMFPHGLYVSERYTNNWFFNYDNTHIMWYFAAILTSYINSEINKTSNKRVISVYVMYVMISFALGYCMSSNSVVTYFIFIMYCAFYKLIKNIKCLNYRTYLYLFILLNVSFVFFRIQNSLSWFIVGILGKSLTLSSRTMIWDKTIKLISKSPVIGYGYEPTKVFVSKMHNVHYTHAHNTLLDITYKGGIISMVTFMMMLFSFDKDIKKCKNREIANIVSIILLCLMVMMIFEARQDKIGLYIIFTLASCINCYKNRKGGIKHE